MHWKPRSWILIGLLFAALTVTGVAQVATTQVADTIYHADGTPATGTVLISWPAFTTSAGESVPSGSTSATIAASGALSVQLISNAGATPIGSYYTVVYHLDDGSVSRQYWVVPQSMAAVKVSAIESTVLPTSVAMQTVSKSYVDTAIAAAVTGHPLDSTPYVLKAGDTMTGPLVLPGDPVSATQAADKNYVDSTVAAVSGGLGQKVSTLPQATQTVTQPAGTQLQVNSLNGELYAGQYVTGRGANGIANAVASPDCASGCEVKATQDYVAEPYSTAALNPQTHVEDVRGGRRVDSYKDPLDVVNHGLSTAQTIDAVATQSEASIAQQTGRSIPGAVGLAITQQGLAGGSNLFPEQVEGQPPYFKMGYSALTVNGTYNTQGQHVLVPEETDCYGVGDCLIGSHFIVASGGFRDSADEGTHPYDLQTHEDSHVFAGTCTTGCTAGSTSVMVTPTSAAGTEGDGRFLIDTLPAKTISSAGTGGSLVSGSAAGPHASAQFSGTNFPVSVFLSIGQAILSQTANIAPGTVTVPIATTGVPNGYATNTVAIGATSGLACVVDQSAGYAPNNYEMAPYIVLDATHLQLTLNKPHVALATLAFGGLCGYGLEQTVDTTSGIRQLFPVVGSSSPTSLYYAGGSTPVVGQMGLTSGFLNVNAPIASVTRSGNVVSVTTAGNLAANINGLNGTIAGVADSSYNGTFAVTTTGGNSFTYAQAGADSTSSGGSASVLTGGFALYPMAEVLSVFDPVAKSVNGLMTLAPNNVAWATSDTVEEPHFYQEYVTADTEMLGQYVPRPTVIMHAGLQYQQNNGPGLIGWSIQNAAPTSNYIGYGGTHGFPDAAYDATGVWRRTMTLDAGEQAAFTIHCNLHGCGSWNSAYNLFELDSNAGADVVSYSPASSSLSMSMRGTPYSFTPQAFTAGTINAGTLNAGTLNGALDAGSIASGTVAAARLPLFGASGATHAPGIVPDPGATAGSTRFLREDGTWSAPSGGGTATFAGAWASGTTYSAGQAVSYTPNGNSYISLVNGNTGNEPDTTPASWGLLASNGGLTPAVTTAIAAAASQVLPLVVDYAAGNSTTMTIGSHRHRRHRPCVHSPRRCIAGRVVHRKHHHAAWFDGHGQYRSCDHDAHHLEFSRRFGDRAAAVRAQHIDRQGGLRRCLSLDDRHGLRAVPGHHGQHFYRCGKQRDGRRARHQRGYAGERHLLLRRPTDWDIVAPGMGLHGHVRLLPQRDFVARRRSRNPAAPGVRAQGRLLRSGNSGDDIYGHRPGQRGAHSDCHERRLGLAAHPAERCDHDRHHQRRWANLHRAPRPVYAVGRLSNPGRREQHQRPLRNEIPQCHRGDERGQQYHRRFAAHLHQVQLQHHHLADHARRHERHGVHTGRLLLGRCPRRPLSRDAQRLPHGRE
jgi:hypothetical protein